MREPNWMTVILLVVMAIAFISAVAWITVAALRRSRKKLDNESRHDA
jgi:hypothetical protein